MGSWALVLTAALAAGGGGDETVLLDFTAGWCGPCKMMSTTVQRMKDEGFPIQEIDIDQHPRVAEQWGVTQIPCFVLVRNGQELERVVGAASYDRLLRMYERAGYRIPLSRIADARGLSEPSASSNVIRGQSPDDESSLTHSSPTQSSPTVVREPLPGGAAWMDARATSQPIPSQPAGFSRPAPGAAQQAALAATVRIWVDDPSGRSCGTGTIIDVHGDEALVVTCGHLFRESGGQGDIRAELVVPGSAGPVPAQLIAYDADELDIALISIRPVRAVQPAMVAPSFDSVARGAAVFSVGCDHGGPALVISSHITAVDRYQNRHPAAQNIEVSGQPVDGRSGGGLFDDQGRLIGICNAADPQDNEGIYAGLKTIHWQLDQIGLAGIYQAEPRRDVIAASAVSSQPVTSLEATAVVSSPIPGPREPIAAQPPAALPVLASALESGAEVICVIRGPQHPQGQVVILDAAARDALARIARDAQSPVVRGQNR